MNWKEKKKDFISYVGTKNHKEFNWKGKEVRGNKT